MRVVLLTNGLGFGGAERIVETLADGLRARGDAVRIAATTRGGPIADALAARGHRVDVLGIRGPGDARVALRLRRVVAAHQAEVLHSHLAVADIAAALVRASMGELRALSTVHNPGVELGRAKRRLWGPALRRMDAVVAVSRAARAGLPAGVSARVLPPSLIDPDRPLPTRAEARRALGLDPACPVVLAVGRLAPVKGLDVLARAAEALPEAEVAVIGEGPERAHLAGTRLRLLGPRADAAQLLPAADVVALPSRSEGFPQVPLHAMAAERPVVATRVGGTPEVVEDGGTGLLVPPEDPRALAEALRHLLATPALARRLGAAGRERLLAKGWTATGMVDATRRLYLELLGA